MKVIVGSSDLWPTPALASKILAIMVSCEGDFGVRARDRNDTTYYTSMVETMAAKIGQRIGRTVVAFEPTDLGSSTAFKRDIRLVKASNEVFVFLGGEGSVEGGTAHVLACALREGLPVTAYGLDDDGSIIEIGSDAGHFTVTQFNHAPTPGLPDEGIEWHK